MLIRPINEQDKTLLKECIERDSDHRDNTDVEFFYHPASMCNVYEIDDKPVMFVRGTKALRLDIQFSDNHDFESNRKVLLEGFFGFVENARNAGFTELIFNTQSPLLKSFCKRQFGFVEVKGELRKFI